MEELETFQDPIYINYKITDSILYCLVDINERLPERLSFPSKQTNGNTLIFYGEYLVYGYYNNKAKTKGFYVSTYRPCSVCWYFTKPDNFTITH